jgi:radical SAM superfamily enzyme YgiQ (UPF0313 family)
VEIYDARHLNSKPAEISRVIERSHPDAIGIGGLSTEYRGIHQVAAMAKTIFPWIQVVIGGPYVSSQPEDAVKDRNIDIAVVGEGEKSGLKVFNALEKGGDLAEISEIVFRRNGHIIHTPPGEYIQDLDEIPFPAWDLIDLESYFTLKGSKRTTANYHQLKKRVATIFTSRGCPYRCTYCHNLFGKKVRYYSVENVIAQMRTLKEKYRIEEVEILDDIFNVDLERAKVIFRRVIEEKIDLKFSLPNGLRSDRMDEELLDIMKQAGVYRLVFAIESGSPRIQKLIMKNVKLDVAERNIESAVKRGFSVGGLFMVGFPTETEEELMSTIDFAVRSRMGTATFSIVTPFPGTELHKMARELGCELPQDYEHFQKVSINLSRIPSIRLVQLRRYAIRKFYLSPRRIFIYMLTSPWYNRFFEKIYVVVMAGFSKYEK